MQSPTRITEVRLLFSSIMTSSLKRLCSFATITALEFLMKTNGPSIIFWARCQGLITNSKLNWKMDSPWVSDCSFANRSPNSLRATLSLCPSGNKGPHSCSLWSWRLTKICLLMRTRWPSLSCQMSFKSIVLLNKSKQFYLTFKKKNKFSNNRAGGSKVLEKLNRLI